MERQPRREHRPERGEAPGEVAVRIGDRAVVARIAVGGGEGRELAADGVDLGGDLARAGLHRIACGQASEVAERLEHRLLDRVVDARDPEVEVLGALDGRDRDAGGRERRGQVAVQAQALERVVVRAGGVQVAPEPAVAPGGVERADLPEVAAREVRLVRVVVADGGEDRDLALAVEGREPGGGRAPAQPRVLFETNLPPRYYLPITDVRMELLRPSTTETHCPYKGVATYWTLDTGRGVHPDAVWIYRSPFAESQKIAGLACFYNERVDLYLDGVLQERPRTHFS